MNLCMYTDTERNLVLWLWLWLGLGLGLTYVYHHTNENKKGEQHLLCIFGITEINQNIRKLS